MLCIRKKDFNQFQTVKQFFERVKEEDGTFRFKDVPIKFEKTIHEWQQSNILLQLLLRTLKLCLKSIQP